MPQPPRRVLAGFPHHVALRGNNRRVLFSSTSDYEQFLYYTGRAKAKVPVDIHAATLMSNHVHMIVRPPDEQALAAFVGRLAQRYAQYRNEQRAGSGKLFERAFFSKPILDDRQLAVTLAYIELNPIRAGLTPLSPRHRWTTYWNHMGLERTAFSDSLWTPSDWYLALGRTDEERRHRYAEWVRDCLRLGLRPDNAHEIDELETRLAATMSLRMRRPDGSRAT